MSTTLTPAPGITVTTYRGATDLAPVIHIDTAEHSGWLRINLNDGPPLFDGDPERHNPPGIYRALAADTPIAPESAYDIADTVIVAGYADTATFAFAIATEPLDARTTRALMAKTAQTALNAFATQINDVRECLDTLNRTSEGDSTDEQLEAAHHLANAARWLADSIDKAAAR